MVNPYLIRNPLSLSLLYCLWHQKEQSVPETQAELYKNFVEQVYKWTSEIELDEEKRLQLHQKLGELALLGIDSKDKEGNFSQFWLRESGLKQVFGTLDNDLCKAALQLGWLNRLGKVESETVYGFDHATFQEYFAALAVEDGDYFLPRNHEDFPIAGKEYRIFAPQWKPVILFWLGREDVEEEKKEAFIEQLVHFKDGCEGNFYDYRAFFLAAAGIREFKGCSRADEIVQQIVKWGFGYVNEEKQKWGTFIDPIKEGARNTLPETDRQRAIERLSSLLHHSQCPKFIRREVGYILEKIGQGNPQAIAALVQLLEQTEDEDTRWWAAETLEKIGQGNPQAIAALVQVLEQTENEYTCRRAAETLGKIGQGNPQAIAALVQVLEQTKGYYFTCREVAESLEKIGQGNQEAIAALVQLLV
ncbi:HEAT repeat domain-containing protein, partial [Roseofilum capinflatum]